MSTRSPARHGADLADHDSDGESSRATAAADRHTVERLRLAAVMLALSLAVFAQSAGNTAADTKIDLVISPLRFLGRALHLWDPIGNAGQLQNQAYGYLFPIGPFYAALHALGVAPWELQRAFESAIVCFAFLGTYRLARRMGIDSFWPALGAGLAYALAPRMLSELTSISAELMPVAALPWVFLPLVDAAKTGSPRRAAARSGVALLFAGGVNAAATVAILPVPALWLLTRTRGRRRRALMGWWALGVALACAWWAIPLVLLGRYSPPFLDWIESSSTTTTPTSLLAVLRGVDHWEGYLGPGVWPGGWILSTGRAAIAATTVVAAMGLAGIAARRTAHRGFLWACLLLGLVLITLGHAATIGPPAAAWFRELLDGPLVPFRNLHKFDPLVRLPLALGVGHALLRLSTLRQVAVVGRRVPVQLPTRRLAGVLVAAIGAVAIAPVWTNHLVSSQRVTPEPSWWSAAAKWLGTHSHGARALVVPGSASPEFVWGGTVDDALQPVAVSPWTVRGAVPLAQAGYVRLLNSIEAKLAGGAGDPALAPLLTRAGIGYVVIENDLDPIKSQATPLVYVRAALDDSPGFHLRAGFGQHVGGSLSSAVSIDGGGSVARPAVEIYSVDGWTGRATLQPVASAVAATGSSDALPQLVERGLGADQAVLFGADGKGVSAPAAVTTDGIRRREASFAGLLAPSATMTQQQAYAQTRPVHDYLPRDPGRLSAYRYEGIADVTASSSGAGALAFLNRSEHNGPWSALDGDPASSWQTSGLGAVGQWLQVRFIRPVTATTVQVDFGLVDDGPAPLPTRVLVTTDSGTAAQAVLPTTGPQLLHLPAGATTRLRITITEVADHSRGTTAAIASLTIPGVAPRRVLEVPSQPASAMFAFDASTGYRSECLGLSAGTVCDPAYRAAGEEDSGIERGFTAAAGDYVPSATVRLAGGAALDRLLDAGNPVQATASSVSSPDPRQRAGAAVDGDPGTVWQAAAGDIHPVLTLKVRTPRAVSGLSLITPATAPVATPLAVTITATGARGATGWTGTIPKDGHIEFAKPVRAKTVTIRIDEATVRSSANSVSGAHRLLAVGIAEAQLDGLPPPRLAPAVDVACGRGPVLDVDSAVVPLQVDAARADVLAGRPVPAAPCAPDAITLPAGPHEVSLLADPTATPVSVTIARAGFRLGHTAAVAEPRIGRWGATDRSVRVDTGVAALLVVHENANAGWQASLAGHRLRSVRVDGWQQGYLVPAGSHGSVLLRFAPQHGFEVGLVIGLVAVLALLALAFGRRRGAGSSPDAPLRDARPAAAMSGAALVLVCGLLAGWAGIVTIAALGMAALLVGRTTRRWAPLLAGAVLATAGLVVARAGPTQIFVQQNAGQVQLLCLTGLGIGALGGFVRRRSSREE